MYVVMLVPLLVGSDERLLPVFDLGPEGFDNKALFVDQIKPIVSLFDRSVINLDHRIPELIGDPQASGTCTIDDDSKSRRVN